MAALLGKKKGADPNRPALEESDEEMVWRAGKARLAISPRVWS
jgi:hypothetical protein